MSKWSLPQLLSCLHEDIEQRLTTARQSLAHPGTKGDASESVWLSLLETYLPKRYQAAKAHAVDSTGAFRQQLDVVIFDRQYSPLMFHYEGQTIIPAESIYAVFEAKQTVNTDLVAYAQKQISSVRRLHRTTIPIPHAGGTYPAKPPGHIIGGLLTLESDWKPACGDSLLKALADCQPEGCLDLGCIAAHGIFRRDNSGLYSIIDKGKPATAFLLELIARLQDIATVPMMDIRAYAKWLE
jgi:hypothetical protein